MQEKKILFEECFMNPKFSKKLSCDESDVKVILKKFWEYKTRDRIFSRVRPFCEKSCERPRPIEV
jgi:hypothetical protein